MKIVETITLNDCFNSKIPETFTPVLSLKKVS